VAYGVFAMTGGCASQLVLFPTTDRIPVLGAHPVDVAFGDKVVQCWVARSPGAAEREPQAFAIEFTGNATRAEHIIDYIAHRWGERPVEVWAVNYPGYGKSTGPARLGSIPGAALAVHDRVRQQAGDRPIFIAGNSLGTAAALHVAANRPTAGLILQNPPALRQLILNRFGWWNLWLLAGPVAMGVPRELDSIANARRVSAPAVFILSDLDSVVPVKYQQMVLNAYAGEVRLIRLTNGDHNTPLTRAQEQDVARGIDWLMALPSRGLP
jgi:pimeloyl-ACP methyl ester carboxylesterase